jgi:anti-sigma regulatory factor (Ser/Thr protein kinase)
MTGTVHVLRLSALELGPLPGAVPSARLHARSVIREWGYPELAGDGELVVSELVANAVRASVPGWTPVGLRLTAGGGRVLVEVQDRSPERPRPRLAQYPDEGGRGLRVVAGVSRRWGYYFADGWKTVWAELGAGAAGPGPEREDDDTGRERHPDRDEDAGQAMAGPGAEG